MKKIKNVLLLIIMMFSLTGCVKFNASMNIKKDKSMDFEIIYAFNSSLVGDEEILSSEDKQKITDQGFIVTDYTDDTMKGFKLVKTIKNIDDVSATSGANYSLSGLVGESEDSYIFEVKKGFLKNTYTAKLNFDASDSGLNEDMIGDLTGDNDDATTDDTSTDLSPDTDTNQETDNNSNTETDTNVNPDENTDTDTNPDMDLSDLQGMLGTMDLSFKVNLPYKAISSNATSTDNNNKNLSWNLTTDQVSTIDFVFELYNMNNIMYIGIGLVVLIIIVIIVIFIKKGKKNKENDIPTVNEAPIAQAENTNVTPIATPTPADVVPPVDPSPVPTEAPATSTISPVTSVGPTITPVVNNTEPAKPVEPVSPVAPASPQITPVQPINPVPPVVPIQVVNPVNPAPVPQEPASLSIAPTPNSASNPEVPIITQPTLGAEPIVENATPGPETMNTQAPTPVVPTPTVTPVIDLNTQPNSNNPM